MRCAHFDLIPPHPNGEQNPYLFQLLCRDDRSNTPFALSTHNDTSSSGSWTEEPTSAAQQYRGMLEDDRSNTLVHNGIANLVECFERRGLGGSKGVTGKHSACRIGFRFWEYRELTPHACAGRYLLSKEPPPCLKFRVEEPATPHTKPDTDTKSDTNFGSRAHVFSSCPTPWPLPFVGGRLQFVAGMLESQSGNGVGIRISEQQQDRYDSRHRRPAIARRTAELR